MAPALAPARATAAIEHVEHVAAVAMGDHFLALAPALAPGRASAAVEHVASVAAAAAVAAAGRAIVSGARKAVGQREVAMGDHCAG